MFAFSDQPARFFPPAETADELGLVAIGGKLSPDWLLDAYRHGIFPWPMQEVPQAMLWWSLDPRGIFDIDRFHLPHRLARTCRSGQFTLSSNRDFAGVIRGCSLGTKFERRAGTWLTPEMIAAYEQLHALGYAHSVEVRRGAELVGGVYGLAIGGLFAAESMFFRVRDASKVALVHLAGHLRLQGYRLWDIQQLTSHTESLGAVEIPRAEYLQRLREALSLPLAFGTLEPEKSLTAMLKTPDRA